MVTNSHWTFDRTATNMSHVLEKYFHVQVVNILLVSFPCLRSPCQLSPLFSAEYNMQNM